MVKRRTPHKIFACKRGLSKFHLTPTHHPLCLCCLSSLFRMISEKWNAAVSLGQLFLAAVAISPYWWAGHWDDRLLIHSMGEQQTPSTRRAVTSWIKSLPGVYLLIISISFYIHIPREGKQRSYCIGFFFCCKRLTLECNKSVQLAMSSIAKIIIIPTSNHSTLIYEAPSMCQAMC